MYLWLINLGVFSVESFSELNSIDTIRARIEDSKKLATQPDQTFKCIGEEKLNQEYAWASNHHHIDRIEIKATN